MRCRANGNEMHVAVDDAIIVIFNTLHENFDFFFHKFIQTEYSFGFIIRLSLKNTSESFILLRKKKNNKEYGISKVLLRFCS